MDDRSFFDELCRTPGIAGREQRVGDMVSGRLTALGAAVSRDRLGNVTGLVRGSGEGRRIMVAAHMDEIGLMITKVTKEGFLHFTTIGGVDHRLLPGQEVMVLGLGDQPGIIGSKPPHLIQPDERNKPLKLEDMFIDTGLGADEAARVAPPGTPVAFRVEPATMLNNTITASRLDNRVGVGVLVLVARHLSSLRHQADALLVATVQEEVGFRGATVASHSLEADVGLAVDVGFGDMPGVSERHTSKMGRGPALALGPNIHPVVHESLKRTAEAHGVAFQTEICPSSTGTDAVAMQITRAGMPTGVVSVPSRYMHSTVETVRWADIGAAARLIAHFIAGLDDSFWEELGHAFD